MLYTYEDSFLRKKVDDQELTAIEAKGIEEAQKLGINDAFYKERFVKAYVYTEIARRHIEAQGMESKLKTYQEQMERYYRLSQTNSPSNISSLPLARG